MRRISHQPLDLRAEETDAGTVLLAKKRELEGSCKINVMGRQTEDLGRLHEGERPPVIELGGERFCLYKVIIIEMSQVNKSGGETERDFFYITDETVRAADRPFRASQKRAAFCDVSIRRSPRRQRAEPACRVSTPAPAALGRRSSSEPSPSRASRPAVPRAPPSRRRRRSRRCTPAISTRPNRNPVAAAGL